MTSVQVPWLTMLALGRKLLTWWSTELISLVPVRIRRILEVDPRRLTFVVTGTSVEVRPGTGDEQYPVSARWDAGRETSDDFDRLLKAEKRRWGPLLTLAVRVPLSVCLIRDMNLPRQALAHAGELLLLDLEHATPFKRQDVYTGWYGTDWSPSALTVRQVILKRSRIDPLLQRLAAIGLLPAAIEVEAPGGERLPVNLLPRGLRSSGLEATLRRTIAACAVALALLALFVVAVSIHRQQQALSLIEAETEVLRKQASDVRRKLTGVETAVSQAKQVRLRKAETMPVVQVWEEVTRLLPETVWITDFRLEGRTVAMDGFAQSASELIGVLARSESFRDVAFTSPVTRDLQRPLERFQIRATVTPVSAHRAAQARPSP